MGEQLTLTGRSRSTCDVFESCDNSPPENNCGCASCLDAVRAADREATYDDYGDRLGVK